MPFDRPLSPLQDRALQLLATGSTVTAAAQAVGVHRNTVGNWLRSSDFREALDQVRRRQDQEWTERTQFLTTQAISVIEAVLADPHAPASLRLAAALAVRENYKTKPNRSRQANRKNPRHDPARASRIPS